MKSVKMLMMAALTILTVSVFAQDSTLQKNKNKETAEVKSRQKRHIEAHKTLYLFNA